MVYDVYRVAVHTSRLYIQQQLRGNRHNFGPQEMSPASVGTRMAEKNS